MVRKTTDDSRMRPVAWGALAAVALLGAACTQQTSAPTPSAPLELSDAETVFVGFNDPAERVNEQIRLLYGVDSPVPLSMTAGQTDEATVQVEVRSDAEAPEGTSGVRCFTYSLDAEMQQAHLEELSTASCPDLAAPSPDESEPDQ